MLVYGMLMNVWLAFFNLLPIPPLDGSHVFKYILPPGAGLKYRQLYAMGYLPIVAFLLFVKLVPAAQTDRKSTRLNSSHGYISYAVFCLKKKTKHEYQFRQR